MTTVHPFPAPAGTARFAACSGEVRVKDRRIDWRMTPDEADELADFIESSISTNDAAMDDVRALRSAVEVARSPR